MPDITLCCPTCGSSDPKMPYEHTGFSKEWRPPAPADAITDCGMRYRCPDLFHNTIVPAPDITPEQVQEALSELTSGSYNGQSIPKERTIALSATLTTALHQRDEEIARLTKRLRLHDLAQLPCVCGCSWSADGSSNITRCHRCTEIAELRAALKGASHE